MIEFGQRVQVWLLHSLAAGGLVLLLGALFLLIVRQPARRRQIGSWAIRAALLLPLLALAPSWLKVPLPERAVSPVAAQPISPERPTPEIASEPHQPPIFALII